MNLFFGQSVLAEIGPVSDSALVLLTLAIGVGLSYLVYFLLSLPMRRKERARLFLDLIETGLREGRSIEHTIVSVSQSQDRSVGVRFHLLAAYLEKGLSFTQALEKVPWLLPPQIVAILKAGMASGQLPAVLPACRKIVEEGVGQVRKAQSYLIILLFVITPATMAVLTILTVYIYPKLRDIGLDMEAPPSWLFERLIHYQPLLMKTQWFLLLWVKIGLGLYIGGPRLLHWAQKNLHLPLDRIVYQLPWRRRRLQRDFSAVLAILLDAGLTEAEAIDLAAAGTANSVFKKRAARAVEDLRRGCKLAEALRRLDDQGEFRWRLANGIHGAGGFQRALTGWQEALDAKAFQQEQSATHIITSVLVLWNGFFVGFVAIATFHLFMSFVNEGLLW